MQLPTAPVKATRISPKILVLYSLPKVGKTEQLIQLPGCLILDGEGGTDDRDAVKLSMVRTKDYYDVQKLITEEGTKRHAAGKRGEELFPYRYLAIDTIDKVEEYAEISATTKYKESTIGKTFRGDSVLELPNGGGYYYLRNELNAVVDALAQVTPHLIITAHVKEKLLNKGGEDIKVNDISLTGKMGSILCAKADAIGYMYRAQDKENRGQLWVSFETYESTVMGARQKYLAGKKFAFDWATIYPDECPIVEDEPKTIGEAQAGLALAATL